MFYKREDVPPPKRELVYLSLLWKIDLGRLNGIPVVTENERSLSPFLGPMCAIGARGVIYDVLTL